jgi:hypothetical protein
MIKAGQQRRFEMESTQEEKLNSVDVSHLLMGIGCSKDQEEVLCLIHILPCVRPEHNGGRVQQNGSQEIKYLS